MITKRIIPCLDVRNGRVVKGTNFEGIKDVADPVEMARLYNAAGADELVFYDITASSEGRALFTDILTRVAREVFIPLTVGGGINTVEDFDRVLKCGADKVSVNSGALRDPSLIEKAALKYGSAIAVGVDARDGYVAVSGWLETSREKGVDFCKRLADAGCSAVIYTDIACDGAMQGTNLPLYRQLAAEVPDLAVTASGGISTLQELTELQAIGTAAAILGKSLYTGAIDLAQVVRLVQQ